MKLIRIESNTFFLLFLTVNSILFSCSNKSKETSESIGIILDSINIENKLKFTSGIQSIFEDSKGNLWFGSNKEGVALYNNSTFRYFSVDSGLSHNQIINIQEAQNGIIWFETGNGLCYYDGKSIQEYTEKKYDSKQSWNLHENDMWFKGDKGYGYTDIEGQPGVYRFHNNQMTYLTFPIEQIKDVKSKYSSSIQAIIKGNNGRLWFGTYVAAIGFDGESMSFIGRKEMERENDTMQIGIRALHEDKKGILWIGDNGGGIYTFDGTETINFNEKYLPLNGDYERNSLNHIISINEDKIGNIWFGTYKSGIWKFDGETLLNFGEKDGVYSKQIKTIYKTEDGTMLFGGMDPSAVYSFNGISIERKY